MQNRTQSFSLDDLVVYCVRRILAGGEECTFERLVYESFTQFPETFGLQRYPQWPDSARINKSWLRCRTDKGWIVGSVKEGFRLTPAGTSVAQRVEEHLSGRVDVPLTSDSAPRERYTALLHRMRSDHLFRRFETERSRLDISDMELRRLLGATLETPLRILRQNLNAYKNAAIAYNDSDVTQFLALCEAKLVREMAGVQDERTSGR